MWKTQQDVKDFHTRFKLRINEKPTLPDEGTQDLRIRLIEEEYVELQDALDDNRIEAIANGMVDLIYVILGTAISYGIDLEPIWDAVHQANMRKIGGGEREDGKILKPPGWEHPHVGDMLVKQGMERIHDDPKL